MLFGEISRVGCQSFKEIGIALEIYFSKLLFQKGNRQPNISLEEWEQRQLYRCYELYWVSVKDKRSDAEFE